MEDGILTESGVTITDEAAVSLSLDNPENIQGEHFAEIDGSNIVLRVIVASQAFIDSGAVGDPGNWKKTSYYTREGSNSLGGIPLRKNYAAIGYLYDSGRNAFIPPKPYTSWSLNESKCVYEAPVAYPNDGHVYRWDEGTLNWVLFQ